MNMQKAHICHYKRIVLGPSVAVMCLTGLFACSPKHLPTSQTVVRDSVVIRINERTVIDTVRVNLPNESRETSTRDTMSHLETSYAMSDATWSSGTLHHTLSTKVAPVKVPVKVTVKDTVLIEVKDTSSIVTRTVEVPAELTKSQKHLISLGWAFCGEVLAGALAALLWWLLRKR